MNTATKTAASQMHETLMMPRHSYPDMLKKYSPPVANNLPSAQKLPFSFPNGMAPGHRGGALQPAEQPSWAARLGHTVGSAARKVISAPMEAGMGFGAGLRGAPAPQPRPSPRMDIGKMYTPPT